MPSRLCVWHPIVSAIAITHQITLEAVKKIYGIVPGPGLRVFIEDNRAVIRLRRCGTATYMTWSVHGVLVHAEPEEAFHLPSRIHVSEVSCGSIRT